MFINRDFRHDSDISGILADVPALIGRTRPSPVDFYAPDAEIFAEEDPTGNLYLVEFGTVRVCRVTADGRRQISSFHFPGEVFGFEAGPLRYFCAESVDACGIRVLRPKAGDPIADGLLPLALMSLTRAREHLLVLGRQNGAEKIAAFLLDLAERQRSDRYIDLSMPRCDIADYLGLSFETVSRILTRLKSSGLIGIPHVRQVEMLDLPALEDLRG